MHETTYLKLLTGLGMPNPSVTIELYDTDPSSDATAVAFNTVNVALPTPYPTDQSSLAAYPAAIIAAVQAAVDVELAKLDALAAQQVLNAQLLALAASFRSTVIPHQKAAPTP